MKYYCPEHNETFEDAIDIPQAVEEHSRSVAALAAEQIGGSEPYDTVWPKRIVLVARDGSESHWNVFYAMVPEYWGERLKERSDV